jgi:hypothetical protein
VSQSTIGGLSQFIADDLKGWLCKISFDVKFDSATAGIVD